MSWITPLLNRYANWMTLIGLLALYLLFGAVILANAEKKINTLAGKEVGVIDLQLGFNPKHTLQMVEDYGEQGRAYFRHTELTLDIVYPIVYSLLFAVIITMIYRKLLGRPVGYLNLLPFVAWFFDLLENITIVNLLSHYPEQSMLMATLCELFKMIKFLVIAMILLVIIVGLVRLLLMMMKKEKS